jgi:hypothetical protein
MCATKMLIPEVPVGKAKKISFRAKLLMSMINTCDKRIKSYQEYRKKYKKQLKELTEMK